MLSDYTPSKVQVIRSGVEESHTVLDLNGCMLNGSMIASRSREALPTLGVYEDCYIDIVDSSSEKTGCIANGCLGIENYGNLTIEDITIKNNNNTFEQPGSGVINHGVFTMNSGKISGNVNANYGAGVYNSYNSEDLSQSPVFNFFGGEICNNSASSELVYGVGVFNDGIMNMYSGDGSSVPKIHDNTGAFAGSGIFNNCMLYMYGGQIYNNIATAGGAGILVYDQAQVTQLGGTAQIYDNYVGEEGSYDTNNLHLGGGKTITLDEENHPIRYDFNVGISLSSVIGVFSNECQED